MVFKTQFAHIDGVKTARPKGQDKPVFGLMSPVTRIAHTEPTPRFALWFIAKYPYAFNVFYTSDYFNTWGSPNPHLAKYMFILKALQDSHYIKFGDKKRLTFKITWSGYFY